MISPGYQTSDSVSSLKLNHIALLVALVSCSSNFHHWLLLALLVELVLQILPSYRKIIGLRPVSAALCPVTIMWRKIFHCLSLILPRSVTTAHHCSNCHNPSPSPKSKVERTQRNSAHPHKLFSTTRHPIELKFSQYIHLTKTYWLKLKSDTLIQIKN